MTRIDKVIGFKSWIMYMLDAVLIPYKAVVYHLFIRHCLKDYNWDYSQSNSHAPNHLKFSLRTAVIGHPCKSYPQHKPTLFPNTSNRIPLHKWRALGHGGPRQLNPGPPPQQNSISCQVSGRDERGLGPPQGSVRFSKSPVATSQGSSLTVSPLSWQR